MTDTSHQFAAIEKVTPAIALADARISRWSAGLMAERRLVCEFDGTQWVIAVDKRYVARESTFEAALHSAYAMTRALRALDQVRAA
ncbi:hypothetical protein ABH945_006936 [Paraburkholderia sp. GAS333]|uniref:hypothetical protein n=1 Tax=Paraburkholderia sp. GAS333 TaxID=3156279 RepID=UPI003D1F356B